MPWRRRVIRRAGAALLLVAGACGDDGADDGEAATTTAPTTTSRPAGTSPTTTTTVAPTATASGTPPVVDPRQLETVVTDLEVPWDVAFVDADTMLITERAGRVRVVDGGALRPEPAAVVDAVARGEGGLLGIAISPDGAGDRDVFLYFTSSNGNRVSRFTLGDDLGLSGEQVILDGIPAARFHNGGRIAFGPDGLLYVTTGDATAPERAADLGSLAGKILRIRPDGGVPDDNPFAGSPVYSYGHRNPQGLAWDSSGQLWAAEHGPTGEFGLCCHDEVNRIQAGGFYGWPMLAGTVEAAGGEPPADPIAPAAASGSATWAPAGVAVIGQGEGESLAVATLAGRALLQFPLADGGTSLADPGIAADEFGRLRISTVGPDGCLYVATSNTDGRGDPAAGDDRLLRAC